MRIDRAHVGFEGSPDFSSGRYVLLDLYGGIYADLDNECMGPPELPSTDGCSVFLAEQFCEGKGCREDQVRQVLLLAA